ncbi:GlcNAc-PI de-N-acetylase [Gelidibacter algens]|uniref:GlcNAc-PI de-N-acetylase n=1 Tax=Gelidibacter algens TaxID=49280 RepID=A0A1A7QV93_9FLAO|nr:PIG-L family deacetylase [Gelidibacter algens]OBX23144.1 LmbE family protein [Gelidibacter algens]RAJ27624.1 GlcNAc-PI de-N-acetylase [Gelidibacter algens]
MFKRYLVPLITLFYCFTLQAQQPKKPTSSEIYEAIEKLNFLGSVLYVAAHPDDENTRLISHMANAVKARTAYLSLTRGDGGQNLIGPEIRELLGIIRTQELVAARKIDGGEQRFTRANDFGYSKHPDETLAIWNKDEVMSDVVWAIRKFQPDIIINRFDHRSAGATHGHHTSSAMLSVEAFDAAADPSKYPTQLKDVDVWQPKREFFNTSWWFYGSQEKFDAADKTNLFGLEVGDFYPALGLSNSEIAALSRSSHKSQGFGNTGARGGEIEYLELVKGDLPKDKNNIFEGIDTSWNRVKGGNAIGQLLKNIQENYNFNNPSASIPKLIEAYQLIQKLENKHWKAVKSEDIKNVIAACAGLYLEVVAESNTATRNSQVKLNLEAINRSAQNITLTSVLLSDGTKIEKNIDLKDNESQRFKAQINIPSNTSYSTPYWLDTKGTLGMYKVEDQHLIGLPETPRTITATFNISINGEVIAYTRPVIYKTNDAVKGEVYKPFEIVPEVSAHISEPVIIFADDHQKDIQVVVKANRENLEGFVQLDSPEGWKVFPEKQNVAILHKGQEQTLVFTVIPPNNQSEGLMTPVVHVGKNMYTKKLVEINYDHIPFQLVLLPSESKVVRLDIKKKGENIGYIEGAGDVVPESLRQIGYHVATIKPEDISAENLNRFDAIVVGIRAYNTVDALKFKQKQLFDFVAQGGNLIVQYNTNGDIVVDDLAPYPLELSRDRVTDENADVKLLYPNHELLNYPNKITEKDFEGWTQERGLYFPDTWSKEFTPLLSMHDKGESPKKGSLLVAKYGKGHYIYTGLSFFREFPEGVAGSFRLFANMLSIGKESVKSDEKLND